MHCLKKIYKKEVHFNDTKNWIFPPDFHKKKKNIANFQAHDTQEDTALLTALTTVARNTSKWRETRDGVDNTARSTEM